MNDIDTVIRGLKCFAEAERIQAPCSKKEKCPYDKKNLQCVTNVCADALYYLLEMRKRMERKKDE